MIERLLETWLNKANERSFQIPFCHALAYQGHTVLHLSRHCGMEMGKDVITIDPEGVPCAYQLKGVGGGRLSQKRWKDEVSKQLLPLVQFPVEHSSLSVNKHHKSFLVINGDLAEEVHQEIRLFNQGWVNEGLPNRQVTTILKGELLKLFGDLESDLWATNLRDIKTYLELMLEDGKGPLKKKSLGKLFESALPFQVENKNRKKRPSKDECIRAVAGCAIICASAISNFTNNENHVAEFEAWTLLWSYTLGLAERWSLKLADIAFILDVASEAMYSSLERLCKELKDRRRFSEGDTLGDEFLYRVRFTHLLGLMGIYGLWRRQRASLGKNITNEGHDDFVAEFCRKPLVKQFLWGEAAIPQFLAWNFYFRTIDSTLERDFLYGHLIKAITESNAPGRHVALASPYYEADEALPHLWGLRRKPLRDTFSGRSWMLESLLHLFVRTNLKVSVRLIFSDIPPIGLSSFIPDTKWQYYLQKRTGRKGTVHERYLRPPHSWRELRKEAQEHEGKDLPALIKRFPIQYLCFLCCVPYRAIPSGVRWLSTALEELCERQRGC